jgi:hypothetical protein
MNRDEIRRVKERIEGDLLKLPGVTGVDIGYKQKSGKNTDQLSIRVFVTKKKKESEIPPDQLIPRDIQGVPTDVIERTFKPHGSS